jgi:hypothetical protein
MCKISLRSLLPFTLVLCVACAKAVTARAENQTSSVAKAAGVNLEEVTSEQLYTIDRIWTVHLRFTADQWEAMEPKGGPGAPGGPGGPRGGGGFGPGMFLAPAFLKQGDTDTDGKLSAGEFERLGSNWFEKWDPEMTGKVTPEQLRAGLNKTLGAPPADGPRPPAGGGRGPGMMLQGAEGKRNGLASAMGIEFSYVRADLEFEGQKLENVAVRYKGNGTFLQSRGSLKRSFKIDLNKNVKGQGIGDVTTLNLHSCVTDASWMNEVLAYRLYRDAGVPAPRTAYARVYVTVEGKYDHQYLGLYSLVEDVSGKTFAEHALGTKKGALFKPVTPALFSDLGKEWSKYQQTYDPKDSPTVDEAKRVIDFAQLVTHGSDEEFVQSFSEFLDLEKFARYMAVTTWISTLDSILGPGQNYYVFLRKKGDRFEFIPWDLDHSFGQFFMVGTQEQREKLSIQKPWQGENRFLERVFAVEAFKSAYLRALEDISSNLATRERIAAQVEELGKAIRLAVAEESDEKVSRLDKALSGEVVTPAPGPFPSQPIKPIKPFVIARSESVRAQLDGKAEGVTIERFGPGGPGGPGRGPGGPGGPGGFGPGSFLAPTMLRLMDSDEDGLLAKTELNEGFARLFRKWSGGSGDGLQDSALRDGINADFGPPPGGPGGPPLPPPQ